MSRLGRARPQRQILPLSVAGGTLFAQDVGGAITPLGAMVRQAQLALAGSVTPTGAMLRSTLLSVAGTVTPSGDIVRQTQKAVAGSVAPTGAWSFVRLFFKTVAGALTPTGQVVRETQKKIAGTVTPSGAQAKLTTKSFAGSVTPTGDLSMGFFQTVAGAVTAVGALLATFIEGGGGTVGFTNPGGQFPGLANHEGEWTAFIAAAGGTIVGDLQSDARSALAAAVSVSDSNALRMSMNDLWKRYQLAGFPLV